MARTVAVLVSACSHALGLAIPLVISISTALAARSGILIKGRFGAGADARSRCGPVRQDRHADHLFALPLAAGVLAWAGVTFAPAVGGLLVSISTIVVALIAQILRRLRLGRGLSP